MSLPLRTLLVENSEDDALLMVDALRRDGYEPEFERVETAATMRAALGAKEWDIILCDYIMPRFDAPAALRIAQECNPDLPVIVVSGTVGEDVAVATIKLGAADYLMKDRLARLGQAVSHALEQKRLRRERMLAEQARRESDAKFATVFREAPVWIVISDATDSIVLEVNDAALQASGYRRDEVVGNSGAELGWIKAEARARLVKKMQEQGRVDDFEMTFRAKDGRELYGLVNCSPILIGERRCTLSVTIDITARKRAEAALKDSSAKLQSILGVAPIGVARVVNRVIFEANGALVQMLGYTPGELYGKEARLLYATNEEYQAVGRHYARLATQQRSSFETRLLTKSGRLIDVAVNAVGFDLKNPEFGTVFAVMDISERKQTEQALRDSEEKFAKAFRASPDAISVHEMDTGRYVDANPGVLHFFGYTRDELIGKSPTELGLWVDPDARNAFVEHLHRDGSVRDFEARFRLRHGEIRVASLSAERIEIGGRPHNVTVQRDMTAQRQYENALRDSEEKFAKAFRTIPDAISISEVATGKILEVNDGFERLSGYARAELVGRTSLELGFWHSAEDRERMRAELRSRGSVRNMEVLSRNRAGVLRNFLLSAEPVEIGGKACLVIVSCDVTEQKIAEQALRESEEKFATAFRLSPDIMSISEFDTGRYIEVNAAHERIFGFSREESIGKSPLELGIVPEAKTRNELLRQLLETDGRVRDFSAHAKDKHGQEMTLMLSAEIIQFGGRRCVLRHSRDITAAVKAEQSLRESEEKFAKAFLGSPYAMSISDLATGQYTDVNTGFEQVSGYSRAEVIGRTSMELGVWLNASERDELIRRLLAEGSVRKMEVTFRARDGRMVVALCSGDLIEVAGRPCILSTLEDITERRKAEKEKALLEAQLKQSQKLEALGTLSGGIAHDFNNILSAMIVYRELAVMDIDRPDELRHHLAEIGAASNRAKDLVRQILTFSRQQQLERRAVQLHPVVREALQLLRASLPATIEISQVIDEQAPSVLADSSQVHQIIMNLGTNAAHAMRDHPGRLIVNLSRWVVDAAQARLHHGLRPGAYVRLSIADTGHGMDESTLARIFEPFFTTKGPGEGTGLGLSVVHGIMENHDGAITVKSRPGEGTVFELFFPEYAGSMSASPESDESTPRGSGESVLLIDDEKPLGEAMRNTLQRLGYRVTAFTDPIDALSRFRAAPQAFDLLVTDHTMPHMTGLDVIQEVHRIRKDLPVVLVSGLSGTWTREKLRGFNIGELVAKPLDLAGLARAVRRTIDNGNKPAT